ncbi:hypothetical protein [Sutterella wadsworthensis]|uniref:hypothetical protein n=1 Tax=Sutterella wadsworthensis TaxID=40545 RepID=UPI003520A932
MPATSWLGRRGLKSLYYNRSDKLRKADRVGVKAERKRIEDEIDMRAVADNSTWSRL